MYDLLIKGGKLIDPGQGIRDNRDIAVSQGKIAALATEIAPGEARRIINARDKIVTPGLIDLHLHVAHGVLDNGVPPDDVGVFSGVTTVCDGGSTGCANFPDFRKKVIERAQTDVFCYVHVCPRGLAVTPEIKSWNDMDADGALRTAVDNRDVVKGFKLRAVGSVAKNLGIDAVKAAKKVATAAGMPLMVHIGDPRTPEDTMYAFTRELLPLLDKGDIATHIYTWGAGGVIRPDGSVMAEFKDAAARGVVLDSAHGRWNFSFAIAELGLAQGILPTTISTDLGHLSIRWPVISLLTTMSKFLALGLSLEQIIERTTINPARVLREEHRRGTLKVGMPADISILELVDGDFTFADGEAGGTMTGRQLLKPVLTLKGGHEITPKLLPFPMGDVE